MFYMLESQSFTKKNEYVDTINYYLKKFRQQLKLKTVGELLVKFGIIFFSFSGFSEKTRKTENW